MEHLEIKRIKACDQKRARELMGWIKEHILIEREKALSVYANLGKSGRHIIWIPTKQ